MIVVGGFVGANGQDIDAVWVTRACAGDRSAFDVLVTRHRQYVYQLAYRLCGQRETAEDACVETFCEAYRMLGRYRPQAKFRTWLHQVAVHVCLEHVRQQRTQHRYLPEAAAERAENVPEIVDTSELALTKACAEQVQRAMESLPEPQKTALCLFYFEQLTCAEIAHVLRIPRNTVKTRLFHGTRALRELLATQAVVVAPTGGGSHADV